MFECKKIVKLFYEEIWNQYDKTRIPQYLHEMFTFRGSLGKSSQGHQGFAQYVDSIHHSLADYHCEIQSLLAEGEQCFARMMFSGVHKGEFLGYPPTGHRLCWAGAAVFTFEAERVVDLWVLGDLYSLEDQLKKNAQASNI